MNRCICGSLDGTDMNYYSKCGFDLRTDFYRYNDEYWDYYPDSLLREKIYIAGAMRHRENFNYASFYKAEQRFLDMDYIVFNPARNSLGLTLKEFMQINTIYISQCNCIYMLKGYKKSSGATAELALASMLGLEILYEDDVSESS